MADLTHRKPALAGTSRHSCHAQRHQKAKPEFTDFENP